MGRIEIAVGDITEQNVDAIVNAAQNDLLGKGGVEGAINRAAGRGLYVACKAIIEVEPGVRCPTGEARITPGFLLPARKVIHTVGPVWEGGSKGEDGLLASCYRKSLELATAHELRSIAFPAISTGAYGVPKDHAAKIAYKTVSEYMDTHAIPEQVTFVFFREEDRQIFERSKS
jgi:O-acetyl-ADP-ribose deacetylase (regulator of RNase III)